MTVLEHVTDLTATTVPHRALRPKAELAWGAERPFRTVDQEGCRSYPLIAADKVER
ncbi:hypothetical protein [Nocardia sp. CS682]|uniref:hypothetical protein n=1 Tax=Nocardia sp. CS682 TaxID=1047172 RepID=UPI0014305538|nr:hypothetical protein [Nocardia sp. CS682]